MWRTGRESNAVKAITANMTSTPSLVSTMMVLTFADCWLPNQQQGAQADQDHRRQVDDARLSIPGAAESACGS